LGKKELEKFPPKKVNPAQGGGKGCGNTIWGKVFTMVGCMLRNKKIDVHTKRKKKKKKRKKKSLENPTAEKKHKKMG